MVSIRLALPVVLLAVGLLLPPLALAEPKPPSDEESADVSFANSFVGKTFDDELEIEGWIDLGGGLVAPPIYVRHYQREEDGTDLVLTSREVSKATAAAPASYVVTDALVVPKPQKDVEFSLACVQGEDEMLRFLGQAKGSENKEWWTDVRRAWEISLETGQIASIKTKGVRCTNPGW
jgi:hypothetical protein